MTSEEIETLKEEAKANRDHMLQVVVYIVSILDFNNGRNNVIV